MVFNCPDFTEKIYNFKKVNLLKVIQPVCKPRVQIQAIAQILYSLHYINLPVVYICMRVLKYVRENMC